MVIRKFTAANVRCIAEATLEPGPGFNVVEGPNGSGKTSLLESIYFLGHGRSFKARDLDRVRRHGADRIEVYGEVLGERGFSSRLGVEKHAAGGRIRVNGETRHTNRALAEVLAVGAFFPGREALVWGSKRERRALLDWIMFHVEPSYGELISTFEKGLRNRNRLLKSGSADREINSWSKGLAGLGESLDSYRRGRVEEFMACLGTSAGETLGMPVHCAFRPGWRDAGRNLAEVWTEDLRRDRQRGWTGAGPQAADIELRCGTSPCRDFLSRGQGKVLALEMFLAAVSFVRETTQKTAVMLLDDLYSELDPVNLERLIQRLEEMGHQTFLTGLASVQPIFEGRRGLRRFHVEQGRVSEVL